jgi:hypothetical protein
VPGTGYDHVGMRVANAEEAFGSLPVCIGSRSALGCLVPHATRGVAGAPIRRRPGVAPSRHNELGRVKKIGSSPFDVPRTI